jgi:hypothetical protein
MKKILKWIWYRFFDYSPYIILGYILKPFVPKKLVLKLTNEHFTKPPQGVVENAIKMLISHQYYKMSDYENMKFNREKLWGVESETNWHIREKVVEIDQYKMLLIDKIKDYLRTNQEFDTICEIGTGDGSFLDELSDQFNELECFFGVDINEKQIIENQKRCSNAGLEFLHLDIVEQIDTIVLKIQAYNLRRGSSLLQLQHLNFLLNLN